VCQDLDILTHRYDAELRVYAEAARCLSRAVGTNPVAAALERASRALRALDNAGEQLRQHVRRHHCLEGTANRQLN
jgi:hypothetical protein